MNTRYIVLNPMVVDRVAQKELNEIAAALDLKVIVDRRQAELPVNQERRAPRVSLGEADMFIRVRNQRPAQPRARRASA